MVSPMLAAAQWGWSAWAWLVIPLAVYGLLTAGNAALYQRSLGININLWWGVVMLVFGILLLLLARASRHRPPATAPGDVHGSGVAR